MTRLLTVTEAAEIARVHPNSMRRAIRKGQISAVRVGGQWRVDGDALTPQLIAQPAKPEPVGFLRFVRPELHRSSSPTLPIRPRDTGAHSDREGLSD